MLYRLLLFAVILLAAAPVLAAPAYQPAAPDPADLAAVLAYLAAGGAAAIVAAALSWLAERLPAFGDLPPLTKWMIQVGASAALGLGAWYLVTYQPALIEQMAPVFRALVLAVTPVLANQLWHASTKTLKTL